MLVEERYESSSSVNKSSVFGEHETASSRHEQILTKVAKIQKSANPYTESCSSLATAHLRVEEQIVNIDSQLTDLQEMGSIYKYWTSAFKEIRLNLIDETLQELEIAANRHIQALGLAEWQIEFKTERENKSGTISHSFTTLIYPNGQTNPVPFESYSGGESQRLQLAVTTALSEILLIRAGISPNIEIMDEPTRALSREGITDLLECLRERATELNRAIFFIDHNSLESFLDKVITEQKKVALAPVRIVIHSVDVALSSRVGPLSVCGTLMGRGWYYLYFICSHGAFLASAFIVAIRCSTGIAAARIP